MALKRKNNNKGIVLIKKANHLIESRYKFDIWETRFFLAVLGQVRREDEEFKVYRIWYRDIIKSFGLKSGDSYAFLRTAAKSLMDKSFIVSYEVDNVARETQYHILRKIDYLKEGQEGRGGDSQEYVDVTVEQEMKPLLLQLQKNFTAYELRNVVKLGVYPMRIYELLKQYESIGERTLYVDEIKKMFEISDEYARFPDFNRWVIKPAVNEINKHTDIEVTKLDYIKEGRRVVALRFVFGQKVRVGEPEFARPKDHDPVFVFEEKTELFNEQPSVAHQSHLNEFSERLFDWWGIQPENFFKRAEGKSESDIELAIEFTKERIRAGKAENPAGVFLEALSKGHTTIEQHKAKKKADREKREREKKELLQPLVLLYAQVQESYTKAVNDAIRALTSEQPEITEMVIERIKDTFEKMGVQDISDKSVEDFRQSPMLRAMVKSEIVKAHPERFSSLNERYNQQLSEIKEQILEIEPDFKFE